MGEDVQMLLRQSCPPLSLQESARNVLDAVYHRANVSRTIEGSSLPTISKTELATASFSLMVTVTSRTTSMMEVIVSQESCKCSF